MRTNTIIHGDVCLAVPAKGKRRCDRPRPALWHRLSQHPPQGKARRFTRIANDKAPYIWWLHDAARVLKRGGVALCFTRYDTEDAFCFAIRLAGLTPKTQIIWNKGVHRVGDYLGDFGLRHEDIIFAIKDRFTFPNRRPVSVLRCRRLLSPRPTHPNKNPGVVLKSLVEAVKGPGDLVLEPLRGLGHQRGGGQGAGAALYRDRTRPKLCRPRYMARLGGAGRDRRECPPVGGTAIRW